MWSPVSLTVNSVTFLCTHCHCLYSQRVCIHCQWAATVVLCRLEISVETGRQIPEVTRAVEDLLEEKAPASMCATGPEWELEKLLLPSQEETVKIWHDLTFRLTHLLLFYCSVCIILDGKHLFQLNAGVHICIYTHICTYTHMHIHTYKCYRIRTLRTNCLCNHTNSYIISLPIGPQPTLWNQFSFMLHYLMSWFC